MQCSLLNIILLILVLLIVITKCLFTCIIMYFVMKTRVLNSSHKSILFKVVKIILLTLLITHNYFFWKQLWIKLYILLNDIQFVVDISYNLLSWIFLLLFSHLLLLEYYFRKAQRWWFRANQCFTVSIFHTHFKNIMENCTHTHDHVNQNIAIKMQHCDTRLVLSCLHFLNKIKLFKTQL